MNREPADDRDGDSPSAGRAKPVDRHDRQIKFAAIGRAGQRAFESASVGVLGVGALGSVAAELLVRSGIGRLRLIDRDVVEFTNLQRQALFNEQDAADGLAKVDAAQKHLTQIDASRSIEALAVDVTPQNIGEMLRDVDLVIDASDNFATRFLLNDWSLETQTAWVHGGAVGASGQVRLFTGRGHPCFRCLVPQPPPSTFIETCDTAGVLAPITHAIASIQVAEALKWLSGNRDAVREEVLSVDLWQNHTRSIAIAASLSQHCRACQGHRDFLHDEQTSPTLGQTVCGRDSVQLPPRGEVDLELLRRRYVDDKPVQQTMFFIRVELDDRHRATVFRDGRIIIDGTSDVAVARTLADRYIGG